MDAGKSLREHGLRIGELEPGPAASIADVAGVRSATPRFARHRRDRGPARTDRAVSGPSRFPSRRGRLNGAGELTGSHQIAEWGVIETPVYLTATMSVGRVYDGAVAAAMAVEPRIGVDAVVIPVVGECDDSWLNDPRTAQVEAERRPAGDCRRDRVGGGGPGRGGRRHRNGLLRLEGRHRQLEPRDRRPHGRRARARELRRRRRPADRRRAGGPPPPPAEPRSQPGRAAASRWWPPTRRSGRPARARRTARRARPGAHRLGGAPRKRRDLRRVLDHGARRARRRRGRRRSRTATSTRSSSPPSMPPRRRC